MNIIKLFAVAGALALSCGAVGAASAATIPDHSFESAVTGGFEYRPTTIDGITFTGNAGVARGTGYTQQDGDQNAFLQTSDSLGARIDITVSGLTVGGLYSFSFFDGQRGGYAPDPYTVLFDNQDIGAFSPVAAGWTARTTLSFTATGETGVLTFSAPLLGGDSNTGIDNITVNDLSAAPAGVPEPAAWALMLVGFGGLGASLRHRRRTLAAAA